MLVIGGLILAAVIGSIAAYRMSDRFVVATVTEKERVCSRSGENQTECKYMVWTDAGVFENRDDIRFWKFNSATVQGQLHVGGRYRLKVVGWRSGLMSWFPNIISVQPVNGGNGTTAAR